MSLDLKRLTRQHNLLMLQPTSLTWCLGIIVSGLLWVAAGVSQKTPDNGVLKYDLQTEMKAKGSVEEVDMVSLGARKDFTELIVKSGDDQLHVYVCPKPFEDEMGISFAKGDEIAVTGSRVKRDASDVILARELVKGTDTLMFRDGKGKPVWDERTGK